MSMIVLKNVVLERTESGCLEGWGQMLKESVHRSSGLSFVSVVKSAELWDGDDSSGWLHSPGRSERLCRAKDEWLAS